MYIVPDVVLPVEGSFQILIREWVHIRILLVGYLLPFLCEQHYLFVSRQANLALLLVILVPNFVEYLEYFSFDFWVQLGPCVFVDGLLVRLIIKGRISMLIDLVFQALQ